MFSCNFTAFYADKITGKIPFSRKFTPVRRSFSEDGCFAGKQIPVAITNVMVKGLTNYPPMSDQTADWPDVGWAKNNYPGDNQGESKSFQVDLTTCFQLALPSIYVSPPEAVAALDGSAVQFTAVGTNIQYGVAWSIDPSGVTSGATIQAGGYSASVTPGTVPQVYTIRAAASNCPDFYDEAELTVVQAEIKKVEFTSDHGVLTDYNMDYAGSGGNNLAKADISPSAVANQIGFESDNTNIALVSPAQASSSPQTITVTGVTNGSAEIQAKLVQATNVYSTLGVDVKKRIDKTIAIHAITEENDDVQAIPVGQGQPNQTCITAGTNGVLDSTAGNDDAASSNSISTGPDGICNTTASGDDVQVINVGNGQPNAICITKGANNFRDTNPSGDDAVNGDSIDAGTNGICDTTANSTNLVPSNVPSDSELEDYLNNTTWGKQANVYFTVTRADYTVNYDLDRDGELADPWAYSTTWAEINQITAIAKDTNVDYNVYNVEAVEYPVALSYQPRAEAWIGDAHQGSTEYVTAHETGHLLGRVGHDGATVGIDLMGNTDSDNSPYRIIKTDWDYVNQ